MAHAKRSTTDSAAKPINVDAQRVLAIMDDLKGKATFLTLQTHQVLDGLQGEGGGGATELLGLEFVRKFAEQIRLEDLYVMLNTNSDGTFAIQEDNDDVREATERLRRSTSELCRQMKTIPTVIGELRRFQDSSQRSMGLLQLLRTLAEMQDVVLKRMTTTVEEERSRQELIAHYLLREKLAVRRKAELKNRLSQVRLEREKAHATRTETLTKLKADLLDVRESTQLKLKQLGQRYGSRMQTLIDEWEVREAGLKKDLNSTKKAYMGLRNSNRDQEEALRKQKLRRETDLDNVIKNFDSRMAELNLQRRSLNDDISKEEEILRRLRDHFDLIDAENSRIEAENIVDEARRRRLRAEGNRLDDAASTVQCYWKGILQREDYHKLRKAMKKKGKKGGKKK
ncbi:hypothetical protein FOZ61_004804 [Perkinsus olseni]|uniref:Dynein regulatory complex protein 10 n=1 Tax=Perkinsus olseni TaxID=32597 RepID=A0A7J6LK26_PEROL|nr:hypothetical protein FOZ61_004804 [Perkinsus olseni]